MIRSRASTASAGSSERPSCTAIPFPAGTVSTRACVPPTVASAKYWGATPAATSRARSCTGISTFSLPCTSTPLPASMNWMYGVGPPRRAGSGSKPGAPAPRRRLPEVQLVRERLVDLRPQLVADREVRDGGGQHDGDGDGDRHRERHPAPERQSFKT